MEQVTLHVCLDSHKACTQCARDNESAPIPFCQKGIILLVKTKQNPTLQSDLRPVLGDHRPDHILSLVMYTPQHPLALHRVQWRSASVAPNRARNSPCMTHLGRFCKRNEPPTFWFRSLEFIFSQWISWRHKGCSHQIHETGLRPSFWVRRPCIFDLSCEFSKGL